MASHPVISTAIDRPSEASPKSLVSAAYRSLRKDIIEGRLAPGSKLRAEHLKDIYNVGAGTLREALALLASDALVVMQEQRGFRVAAMSYADFQDITETRVVLECHALRLAIQAGDDQWECELIGAFHMLNLAEQRFQKNRTEMFEEWEMANKRFHEALISRCDTLWTERFLKILYSQAERYRRFLLPKRPEARDVHEEHKAIFNAAMARDPNTACDLLSAHIRYNLDNYKNVDEKSTITL
ncbi:transcriptional regulator [Sphingomonas sp. Root710]|uniref:FCD domain-containing protein n=1 Tax=Sphingomonas sp. Root710 TaxID=1736594 RepID=UPI0006F8B4C5|nr:FCD domain-containing protein [Sphingomonas sp. Root710]KRB81075.1 transcriptional regulator [Sphingomonas sp. Root710]